MNTQRPFSPWFWIVPSALLQLLSMLWLFLVQAYALRVDVRPAQLNGYLEIIWIAEVIVGIGMFAFWYQAWKTIQDGFARMTPGKAVGYCFIPVFNLYWGFQVTLGFCTDYNNYLRRHNCPLPRLARWPWVVSWMLPILAAFLWIRFAQIEDGLALGFPCAAFEIVPILLTIQAVARLRKHLSGAERAPAHSPWVRAWPLALLAIAAGAGRLCTHMLSEANRFATDDAPTIQVTADLPGASTEVMAASVISALERGLARLPHLVSITSTTVPGVTQATLRFEDGRDMRAASPDIQAAIDTTKSRLPTNMPSLPSYRRTGPTVIYLALSSEQIDAARLTDFAEIQLCLRLSQLPGVGAVSSYGGTKNTVRVQLDPTKLGDFGVTADEVAAAMDPDSAAVRGGRALVDGPRGGFVIQSGDNAFDLLEAGGIERLGGIVVAIRADKPVHLRDLARIVPGLNQIGACYGDRTGQHPSILVAVTCAEKSGRAEVIGRVKLFLPQLEAALPQAIRLQTFEVSRANRIIICRAKASEETSSNQMLQFMHALQDAPLKEPDVESYVLTPVPPLEAHGAMHAALLMVRLRDDLSGSVEQTAENLRSRVAIAGLTVQIRPATAPLYGYTIYGPDTQELYRVASLFLARLKTSDVLRDVDDDLPPSCPVLSAVVDRESAARLGVSTEQLDSALMFAGGTYRISRIGFVLNQRPFDIIIEPQDSPDSLNGTYVRTTDGKLVPTKSFLRMVVGSHHAAVNHWGQFPSVTFTWTLHARMREREAKAFVEKAAQEIVPAGISGGWSD